MNSIGATIMGSTPEESPGSLPEFLLMRETHQQLMDSFVLIGQVASRSEGFVAGTETTFRGGR